MNLATKQEVSLTRAALRILIAEAAGERPNAEDEVLIRLASEAIADAATAAELAEQLLNRVLERRRAVRVRRRATTTIAA